MAARKLLTVAAAALALAHAHAQATPKPCNYPSAFTATVHNFYYMKKQVAPIARGMPCHACRALRLAWRGAWRCAGLTHTQRVCVCWWARRSFASFVCACSCGDATYVRGHATTIAPSR